MDSPLKNIENERLKVEKGLEVKPKLFNLRFSYFLVLMICCGILIVLLASNFSMKNLTIYFVIGSVVYFALFFLEDSNYLENMSISSLPDYLENDLYLKNEPNSTAKPKLSHTTSREG